MKIGTIIVLPTCRGYAHKNKQADLVPALTLCLPSIHRSFSFFKVVAYLEFGKETLMLRKQTLHTYVHVHMYVCRT